VELLFALLLIAGLVGGVVHLVCSIQLIRAAFEKGDTSTGVACILFLVFNVWPLLLLIGWAKNREFGIRRMMWIWTWCTLIPVSMFAAAYLLPWLWQTYGPPSGIP